MEKSELWFARARQWLGWTNRQPAIAVSLHEDAVWMLALRDRPFRITACGSVPLSIGTVRHGKLRLVGLAADATRSLATHLHLRSDWPVIAVVAPSTAFADPNTDTVHASLDSYQVDAVTRLLKEAGFSNSHLDPVPAAIARAGRMLSGPAGFAAGSGWLTGWADEVSEATPSGSVWDSLAVGSSPTSLMPVSSSAPVGVAQSVKLDGPWPLLLGAALSKFEHGPDSEVLGVAPPAVHGWAAEPIGGVSA